MVTQKYDLDSATLSTRTSLPVPGLSQAAGFSEHHTAPAFTDTNHIDLYSYHHGRYDVTVTVIDPDKLPDPKVGLALLQGVAPLLN